MLQSGGAMLIKLGSGHARQSIAGITQVKKCSQQNDKSGADEHGKITAC